MSTPIDTKTFNELPPLHKEVVTDFFKVLDKEDGNVIDNIETAVDKTADFHNVNTDVLYNYIDKEVDAQLGV
jgi:hypothetical protein